MLATTDRRIRIAKAEAAREESPRNDIPIAITSLLLVSTTIGVGRDLPDPGTRPVIRQGDPDLQRPNAKNPCASRPIGMSQSDVNSVTALAARGFYERACPNDSSRVALAPRACDSCSALLAGSITRPCRGDAGLGFLLGRARGSCAHGWCRAHQREHTVVRIERAMIILIATTYVTNTIAELADMIGVITLHPSGRNAFSLLSSSVAIWVANL